MNDAFRRIVKQIAKEADISYERADSALSWMRGIPNYDHWVLDKWWWRNNSEGERISVALRLGQWFVVSRFDAPANLFLSRTLFTTICVGRRGLTFHVETWEAVKWLMSKTDP